MRADNRGEGGILALLSLIGQKRKPLVLLGIFGAALLYGDGMITPPVSVLGAIEGLDLVTDKLKGNVHWIAIGILLAIFLLQRRGTGKIGSVFGPTMLLWFVAIAAMGVYWIAKQPRVLTAVSPLHAVEFMRHHGVHGFLILGAVVLCITGGEALYADMGHFGRVPIRIAWYAVVFPALLLNYFGQGALYLTIGRVDNPFFSMVGGWLRYPLIAIATAAACIASQALISGAFSLTRQAVQLGYWPRVSIVHTSGATEGQIYIPEINNVLLFGCVAITLGFKKSSELTAAYGIAVTGTMAITSILFFAVARANWKWSLLKAGALVLLFLAVDLAFFGANAVKIHDGGWLPLAIGVGFFTLMTTWNKGRALLGRAFVSITLPLDMFLEDLARTKPHRVKGTAVFMTSNPDGAPPVLLHHFKHNKTLHEQVVLLSIGTREVPEVPPAQRIDKVVDLGHGFFSVRAVYGFMQTPNVQEVLLLCARAGLETNPGDTSFFLGRETLLIGKGKMWRWRKILFAYLSRNARPANAFFQIPPNRVVELGTQIEL
jgi:KUP system potassium uptake protein